MTLKWHRRSRRYRWHDRGRKGPKKARAGRWHGTSPRANGANPWCRAADRRGVENAHNREVEENRYPRRLRSRMSWASLGVVLVFVLVGAVLAGAAVLHTLRVVG